MIKLFKTTLMLLLLAALFVVAGCANQEPQPTIQPGHVGDAGSPGAPAAAPSSAASSAAPLPTGSTPEMPVPMMSKDPRTVTETAGKVVNVTADQLFIEKGPVTIKFHLTPKTVVKPAGKKLAIDQNVKIKIEHVPDGMNASEVEIQP